MKCLITYRFGLLILGHNSIVDQSMVVKEQSAGDVEGNEHINTVVLMSSQDEKYSKTITEPGEGVKKEDSSGSVLCDEEVKEGQ